MGNLKMAADEPQDSPALAALTALGRDAPRSPTAAELDNGLHELRTRVATAETRRRTMRRWTLAGVGAMACLAIVFKVFVLSRPAAPGAGSTIAVSRIEGGTILDGGYLSQAGSAGIRLFFGEGSRIELAPDTRGRLRAVTREGAHLSVERGTASLHITRNPAHRWLIEAGPFTVTVKGTVFSVSWDPSSERFELRLQDGRVVVSGPTVGDALALRAGQRLVVSLPRAESVITDQPSTETSDAAGGPGATTAARAATTGVATASKAPPGAAPSARAPAASSPGRTLAAAPAGKAATSRRWASDLAKGRWDNILADVDRDGVDAILDSASSADLFVLADAARYRRRADLARAALMAQRRRFPHSARAMDAVFLLGRAEELRADGAARAITWYDEYLERAPAGGYAAEALGRKMILTSEMRGPAAARPIAEAYLLRFPSGSYAGAARALRRVP
jgi:hypothetical protein